MIYRITLTITLAFTLTTACTGPAPTNVTPELDYTEISDATGWHLRIYGNGSGSIHHAQLPAYHLHYPRATFAPEHPRRRAIQCAETGEDLCSRLSYYSARLDSTFVCTCVSATWTEKLMAVAIDQMDRAVEAGADERSCRMLRRHWYGPGGRLVKW